MLKKDNEFLINVIVRTMNSVKSIECWLKSICEEYSIRKIIMVDGHFKDNVL